MVDIKGSQKKLPEAHLRDSNFQNQCTFSFHLEYKSETVNINEEIQAVRQLSEPLNSLFEHIKNKIIYVIQHKDKDVKIEEENEMVGNRSEVIQIPMSLKQGHNRNVSAKTTLKQIFSFDDVVLTFHIFNLSFNVLVNCPLVHIMKLPDVLYAGFTVQATIKGAYIDQKCCSYVWYVSKNNENWIEVGTNYNYMIKDDEVDNYLKLIYTPKNSKLEGGPLEIVSENVVIELPDMPDCPFDERHKITDKQLIGNEFRITSYNTLSMRYTHNQFEYCEPKYLDINYRKKLLMKEICGYNSDIICMQEVDCSIYSFYFRKEFKKINYGSIYNKKGNRIPEGLAIMYNKNRFSFAGQGQIVFSEDVKTNPALRNISKILEKSKSVAEVFMKQATSMQFCKLKLNDTNKLLIVANTHLFYHPDANLVRTLQTACCVDYLKSLVTREKKNNRCLDISVIFCGDCNSQPDSDVYKFLTDGVIQYKDEIDYATTLFHPFEFESACGTPDYTNYTGAFKACLDYIFYEKHLLSVQTFAPFPNEEILAEYIGLPSKVFPSDHLALVADFKFN